MRDDNGNCVEPSSCNQCPSNSSWTDCGLDCTPTCEDTNPLCDVEHCVARCECDEDYVDNGQGECILEMDCPATTTDAPPSEETTIAINSPNPGDDGENEPDNSGDNNDDDGNDDDGNNGDGNGNDSGNDGNNGATGGFGDPHFHVLGRSENQPDLCFDYDGTDGSNVMTILDDKDNNIVISSTLFKEESTQKTYFKSITMVQSFSLK